MAIITKNQFKKLFKKHSSSVSVLSNSKGFSR